MYTQMSSVLRFVKKTAKMKRFCANVYSFIYLLFCDCCYNCKNNRNNEKEKQTCRNKTEVIL